MEPSGRCGSWKQRVPGGRSRALRSNAVDVATDIRKKVFFLFLVSHDAAGILVTLCFRTTRVISISLLRPECFLYPVQEGQCSPDFLLKENKDTVITVNNIDFKKKGLSSIYLNHHQCIVQLAYNGAPSTGRCHTLNTSDGNVPINTVIYRKIHINHMSLTKKTKYHYHCWF